MSSGKCWTGSMESHSGIHLTPSSGYCGPGVADAGRGAGQAVIDRTRIVDIVVVMVGCCRGGRSMRFTDNYFHRTGF